jgi:hypothetical protein
MYSTVSGPPPASAAAANTASSGERYHPIPTYPPHGGVVVPSAGYAYPYHESAYYYPPPQYHYPAYHPHHPAAAAVAGNSVKSWTSDSQYANSYSQDAVVETHPVHYPPTEEARIGSSEYTTEQAASTRPYSSNGTTPVFHFSSAPAYHHPTAAVYDPYMHHHHQPIGTQPAAPSMYVGGEISPTGSSKPRSRFRCDICEKDFKRKENLKCHMRIHTGDLPFECPKCKKRYRFRSGFKIHLRRCKFEHASDDGSQSTIKEENKAEKIKEEDNQDKQQRPQSTSPQ